MHIGPIQPHKRLDPYGEHPHKQQKEDQSKQDQKSFQDELKQDMLELDELPRQILRDVNNIITHKVMTVEQIGLKINNLYIFGLSLVREINQFYLIDKESPEMLEENMILLTKALFIGIYHYGEMKALTSLITFWKELNKGSIVAKQMHSFFQLIGICKQLPLDAIKNIKPVTDEERLSISKRIKSQLHEALIHQFPIARTQKLLSDFNFGV